MLKDWQKEQHEEKGSIPFLEPHKFDRSKELNQLMSANDPVLPRIPVVGNKASVNSINNYSSTQSLGIGSVNSSIASQKEGNPITVQDTKLDEGSARLFSGQQSPINRKSSLIITNASQDSVFEGELSRNLVGERKVAAIRASSELGSIHYSDINSYLD